MSNMQNFGQKKNKTIPATQHFLDIEEIKEGVVVLKNTSLRSIILVSSVNFALKSDDERNAMIMSYQSFLNSLNFPVQIIARSRKLQLDDYIQFLQKAAQSQNNELLKAQTVQYTEFVAGLIREANIMEKRFFVVVPYYPVGVEQVGTVKKFFGSKKSGPTDFETQKMELMQRIEQVVGGLSAVGLRCVVLNTEDLIELLYTVYNPDTAGSEKMANTEDLEAPIITSEEGGENAA